MRALLLATVLVACGGKSKQPDTTPDNTTSNPPPDTSSNGTMVPPEKMDEIQRDLQRKGDAVSRCLTNLVDNKELPKTTKGKMTLEIKISGGRAGSVKVVNTTLDNKNLQDCVVKKVQEIEFPQLANAYETSYTYSFEAF